MANASLQSRAETSIDNSIKWICGFKPAKCTELQAAFTTFKNSFSSARAELMKAQLTCSRSLLAYSEGMMCFACNADFSKFIDNTTNVVKLATRVCTDVSAVCSPVFTASRKLLRVYKDIIDQVVTILTGKPQNSTPPDLCGGTISAPGNCQTRMCNRILRGFGLPLIGRVSIGRRLAQPSTMDEALRLLEQVHSEEHRQLLLEVQEQTFTLPSEFMASGRQLNTGVTNQYTAGGYDAYGVGCTDVSCPPTPSSASSQGGPQSSAGAIAGAVVGVFGVGALVAGVYFYRRRLLASAPANANTDIEVPTKA
jgi:hypothetical protein